MDDRELLDEFVKARSQSAFRELVERHLPVVYSAARRMVRDSHLAEEVAQSVFTTLAQKADSMHPPQVLGGWLYNTTRHLAMHAVRTEQRRREREQTAFAMQSLDLASDDPGIAEHLEPAMAELAAEDRDALVLRFLGNRGLREVGAELGISEEAARKRVSRALDRLRAVLESRGITATTVLLATALTASTIAVPIGLGAAITATAITGIAVQTSAAIVATKTIAMTTLQKTLITAAVLAGVATTLVVQRQSQGRLRDENQSLRQQVVQLQTDNETLSSRVAQANSSLTLKLPAPPMSAIPRRMEPPEDVQSTNLIARLLKDGQATKLTGAQVASYLKENRRSASSLLAAYRTTADSALLEEAKQKYPDDPQVAFEAAFKKDTSLEERRPWLEAFKKSAPDNALPNYLSALDYFKAGQPDQAVSELIAASGKQEFQDYTLDRLQDDEEAYLAAGYSVAEAKAIPALQLLLPQLAEVKQLGLNLVELANSYRQAGDPASAQAALQMAANLGQRYGNTVVGETEISRLVGMAVERIALNAMEPNSPYGSAGQTVKDRLDHLAQQSADLKQVAQQTEALQHLVSDQDWISYKDRWRVFGEEAAGKWLIKKYGQK